MPARFSLTMSAAHSTSTYHQMSFYTLPTVNITVTLLIALGAACFLKYRSGLKAVAHFPGMRVPFYPTHFPGAILPTTWWNPGYLFLWNWRHTNYTQFGVDTFSVVPFIAGSPSFYTANLDVLRQVAGGGHKTSFAKIDSKYDMMRVWGMNLLSADKEMWRKHRRVVAPAFNPQLYQEVWAKTLQIYQEALIAEGWNQKKAVSIPCIQTITFKVALLIIAQCGFGFDFGWSDPPRSSSGCMSVQEAFGVVTNNHLLICFAPKWLLHLPYKRFQEVREAQEEVGNFMKAQVAERKKLVSLKKMEIVGNDIFTTLVKANEDEGGKFQLDDSELIGNVFVMLLAGHETTAHALAAALGLLSVDQEIQEEVYQQILSVCGQDGEPSFEDYEKLDKVQAVFYEAARLFPAAHILFREAWEDTILRIPKAEGQDGTVNIPVPKDTPVIVDMVGVQYNPRYFEDPTVFKPSRWHGISNDSDAFLAFSIGPRACVGRKFASFEAVAFLTSMLRDFSVYPLLSEGETIGNWKARVLDAKLGITLGVKDVPLKLVKRI
ncbi:cytochrome P450 [Crepidotus variabilis]|uniref:Cytochrome P450 n=1 Tax=Crepidotus variabilis TaxID=179855 RepID=A0A9P6JQN5_9AGAR|nr:cytochrome P450 [Crepidotus variabilis]